MSHQSLSKFQVLNFVVDDLFGSFAESGSLSGFPSKDFTKIFQLRDSIEDFQDPFRKLVPSLDSHAFKTFLFQIRQTKNFQRQKIALFTRLNITVRGKVCDAPIKPTPSRVRLTVVRNNFFFNRRMVVKE